jgi:SAM-dependent methyltransferase
MDLSQDAIAAARHEVSVNGLRNIEFVAIDLSDFHEKAERESFAFIATFDAVHDQAAPLNVLKGIHRALRTDGVYLMQDIKASSHVHNNIAHPIGTFLYTVSCMHCMTVSLAQGGEGLGAMWVRRRRASTLSALASESWRNMNSPMTSRTTGTSSGSERAACDGAKASAAEHVCGPS